MGVFLCSYKGRTFVGGRQSPNWVIFLSKISLYFYDMTPKIFILMTFLLLGTHTQAQRLIIDANLRTSYIEQLSVFTDSTKNQTLKQIATSYKQGKFAKTTHFADPVGIGDFDYWFVCDVKNQSDSIFNTVFEIPLTRLKSFSVYVLKNDSLHFEAMCGGTNTDIYDKPLWSYNHAVSISFQKQEQKLIFFKVNKFPGSVRASVIAHSPKEFDKKQRKINSLLSFMLGIGCIVFFTSCMIGIFQHNYAYYIFAALTVLRVSHNLQFFNYSRILNSIGFGHISSSTVLLISLMFQYQFFKLYFKEKNPTWIVVLVTFIFVFDVVFGYTFQSNKYYYYLSYAVIFSLGAYYVYEISLKFKHTHRANYAFLVIEILMMLTQALIIIRYQINFSDNIFRKHDYELFLWGSLIELITFLVYLFRGIILLNADYLKKSLALTEAQRAIIQTQEAERKHIAQDLHDDLGATLSTLKGRNKQENFSEETQNLLNKAIADLRAISRRLLPVDFEMLGFIPSIEKYISDINQQQYLKVTFIIFGEIVKLNPEKELNIYRIITELVNNSTKYSNGQNATVQLVYHQNYLFVSIEDDGIVESKTDNNLGIGLKNINSRLDYLNANPIEIGGQRNYSYVFEIPYSPNL